MFILKTDFWFKYIDRSKLVELTSTEFWRKRRKNTMYVKTCTHFKTERILHRWIIFNNEKSKASIAIMGIIEVEKKIDCNRCTPTYFKPHHWQHCMKLMCAYKFYLVFYTCEDEQICKCARLSHSFKYWLANLCDNQNKTFYGNWSLEWQVYTKIYADTGHWIAGVA